MKKLFFFIFIACFLLSCSTAEQRTDYFELKDELNNNFQHVKLIQADSPDWCSYREKCKYMRDAYCETYNLGSDNKCNKKVAIESLKTGADVFVFQTKNIVLSKKKFYEESDYTEAFAVYGQAYRCTDKFKSIGDKFLEYKRIGKSYRFQMTKAENEKRCKRANNCKFIKELHCKTQRSYIKCLRKLKDDALGLDINKVVITNEKISNGSYSLIASGFQCEINSLD